MRTRLAQAAVCISVCLSAVGCKHASEGRKNSSQESVPPVNPDAGGPTAGGGAPMSENGPFTVTAVADKLPVRLSPPTLFARLKIKKNSGVTSMSSKTVTGNCTFQALESSKDSGLYELFAGSKEAGSCTGSFRLLIPTQSLDKTFTQTVTFDPAATAGIPMPGSTSTPEPNYNEGISGSITPSVKLQSCAVALGPIPQGRVVTCSVYMQGRGDFVLNLRTENCAASLRADEIIQEDNNVNLNGSWSHSLVAKGLTGDVCKIYLNLKSNGQSVSADERSVQL